MISAVIVEDERLSADRLKKLLSLCATNIEIVAMLDSVESCKDWLRDNSSPDLMFLDIELNDGTAFDLLAQNLIKCPVVFTTAYDSYAIKAFKYTSVDYLLKPINKDHLENALIKYEEVFSGESPLDRSGQDRLGAVMTQEFKKRFLVKLGERFQSIEVTDIAYVFYQNTITYVRTKKGEKWPLDQTLENLEHVLNPLDFFRVNRKLLVSLPSISEIHTYFNSRLLLRLNPSVDFDVIVSRDRVHDFKRWMDL